MFRMAVPVAVATGVPQPDHFSCRAIMLSSMHRTATMAGLTCGMPVQSAKRCGPGAEAAGSDVLQPTASSLAAASAVMPVRYRRMMAPQVLHVDGLARRARVQPARQLSRRRVASATFTSLPADERARQPDK